MLTKEEAAARLDGNEYGEEGSKDLFAEMKAAGLVAVFGASDDLIEFRGAIDDEDYPEIDIPIRLSSTGLMKSECDDEGCPYFAKLAANAPGISAKWDDGSGFSWRYETSIPHAKFVIVEEGETYCEGIVFALDDLS